MPRCPGGVRRGGHKTPTTANPSDGIEETLAALLDKAGLRQPPPPPPTTPTTSNTSTPSPSPLDQIASLTIGTTHFINALTTRSSTHLSRVAVLRLCGPYSKHTPPCTDWPPLLRKRVLGYYELLKGGLEVDGSAISAVDAREVERACGEIRARRDIGAVVVCGVFAPIDDSSSGGSSGKEEEGEGEGEGQEEQVERILRRELGPRIDIVRSKTVVAQLGFLERENAAILNAAILRFARYTLREFRRPVKRLGLTCPVFVAQNDGTVLTGEEAERLPIRTFAAGPTNSMRGAAWLVGGGGEEKGKEEMMVVDIGGTTTDVGLLLASGFPRQQAAYSQLGGVRMNFSCPDVRSIGLGGGSLVRRVPSSSRSGNSNDSSVMRIGPESVGHRLAEQALVFGGDVPTATDYTVAANMSLAIGDPERVRSSSSPAKLPPQDIQSYLAKTKRLLEHLIDTTKTSPEPLPVVLVGGGAILAPDSLKGASRVVKPKWASVANAVGAAVARVSGVVDTIRSTGEKGRSGEQILEEVKGEARERAVRNGALRESVEIVEVERLPLQYIAGRERFVVRAVGEFDFGRGGTDEEDEKGGGGQETTQGDNTKPLPPTPLENASQQDDDDNDDEDEHNTIPQVSFDTYTPKVIDREWHISETDLQWITTGCYILGTGGGGSPYSSMLRLRSILRAGGTIKVVSPDSLKDDDRVGCGGGAGSPTVGIEKLAGDEMLHAQQTLYTHSPNLARPTHMIPLEIGGSNGLQGLILSSPQNMNVPCVDGDWMGRAYPTKWQTTPVVFAERPLVFAPVAIADGNGSALCMPSASSDRKVEEVLRAALTQMGSHVGVADGPVSGAETRRWVVGHTVSLSWRIGRAVARARAENEVGRVGERIVEAVGGSGCARILCRGKIVGVTRELRSGHVYGEVVVEGVEELEMGEVGDEDDDDDDEDGKEKSRFKIPFKNENIAFLRTQQEGEEQRDELVAAVPDLIAVIDAQNGEAVGTPEYRYGLLVLVLVMAASDRWTGSQRGLDIGGLKGFDMEHLGEWRSAGEYVRPRGVVEEFG